MSQASNSDHQVDEQSLPEEYIEILERQEGEEEEDFESRKSEECFCSFFSEHFENPTLKEYQQKKLKDALLFQNVLTLDKEVDEVCVEKPSCDPDDSILVTGFGIRNLESLQSALLSDEKKRIYELYKNRKQSTEKLERSSSSISPETPEKKRRSASKRSTETETEMSSASSDISAQQQKLSYLMGLQLGEEEEAYPSEQDLLKEMLEKESEDRFIFAEKSTTKSSQKYLRTHRIFDFFQFIIAHLLSAAPENPIVFILVLLNKILLYRAGTGNPPLLYEKKHIEQLFSLMDRMNTGFIDLKQYTSGMNTLGICEYNKKPQMTEDELVSREVFVKEALESETALFNDLIRRKWIGGKPEKHESLSDMRGGARSFISATRFIPSDIFLKSSKKYSTTVDLEGSEGEGTLKR